ncbi:MAG: hypothetical protein K2M43_03200 [Mycoplasmoidaceae bacterium]|nr:hypothetical protein [Mycoplasmoidaceae bacterium]
MGFVGSSGKGAMPIPITIEEYENIHTQTNQAAPAQESEKKEQAPVVEQKPVYETDLRIGDTVHITNGSFAGTVGDIKNIDIEKGTATVEVELFGRLTSFDIPFADLELD